MDPDTQKIMYPLALDKQFSTGGHSATFANLGSATSLCWVEARDAAEYSTMPTGENYPAQNVTSVETLLLIMS